MDDYEQLRTWVATTLDGYAAVVHGIAVDTPATPLAALVQARYCTCLNLSKYDI